MSDTCDPQLYERGVCVAVVHSVGSENIEDFVRDVRLASGVAAVDWHYFAGRGRVVALGSEGELASVRSACGQLLPRLHAMLPGLYPMVYNHPSMVPNAGYVTEASS